MALAAATGGIEGKASHALDAFARGLCKQCANARFYVGGIQRRTLGQRIG